MSKPPSRYVELELKIGADSVEALAEALGDFANRVAAEWVDGNVPESGCSGGSRYGHSYKARLTPGMTEAAYRTALNKWLRSERAP